MPAPPIEVLQQFESWPAPPATSPQVGGHLAAFLSQWSALGASPVLCSIEGLQLEISDSPPLQRASQACDSASRVGREKLHLLDNAIHELHEKRSY